MSEKKCSGNDWYETNGQRYCKVHNAKFTSGQYCPSFTPPPPFSVDGKQEKAKRESSSEQAVEQGVIQGVTGLTRRDVTVKEQFGSSVRSHAFRFVVSLESPKNWSVREQMLKSKGITVIRKGGVGDVGMVQFKGFKLWLSKHKITVYFPNWKQYFVDEAITGYNYAIADLKDLLNEFEAVLESDFKIGNTYRISVGRQHHAIMRNSLAKIYNRDKKKLEVKDMNGELWLLIDNSSVDNFRQDELEGVGKKTAPDDVGLVKMFFNQTRDTGLLPEHILTFQANTDSTISKIGSLMESLVKESATNRSDVDVRLAWMDRNFASHQRILEKIETRLDALNDASVDRIARAKRLLKEHGW